MPVATVRRSICIAGIDCGVRGLGICETARLSRSVRTKPSLVRQPMLQYRALLNPNEKAENLRGSIGCVQE